MFCIYLGTLPIMLLPIGFLEQWLLVREVNLRKLSSQRIAVEAVCAVKLTSETTLDQIDRVGGRWCKPSPDHHKQMLKSLGKW